LLVEIDVRVLLDVAQLAGEVARDGAEDRAIGNGGGERQPRRDVRRRRRGVVVGVLGPAVELGRRALARDQALHELRLGRMLSLEVQPLPDDALRRQRALRTWPHRASSSLEDAGGNYSAAGDIRSMTAMTPAYDPIGRSYARHRRPDRGIAARILAALGDASSLVDVGAGTGSYEPLDRLWSRAGRDAPRRAPACHRADVGSRGGSRRLLARARLLPGRAGGRTLARRAGRDGRGGGRQLASTTAVRQVRGLIRR